MVMGGLAVRHEAASAAVVRHAIAADLEQCALTPETVDDVILVVSELIGNAVVHACAAAGDGLAVSWELDHNMVLVRVDDGSTDVPQQRASSTCASSGRGLAIVAAIAVDWGVQRTAAGKQVWARVPVAMAS